MEYGWIPAVRRSQCWGTCRWSSPVRICDAFPRSFPGTPPALWRVLPGVHHASSVKNWSSFPEFRCLSCLFVSVQVRKIQLHSKSLHSTIFQLVPEQSRHKEGHALQQQNERDPLIVGVVDSLSLLLFRGVGPDAWVAVFARLVCGGYGERLLGIWTNDGGFSANLFLPSGRSHFILEEKVVAEKWLYCHISGISHHQNSGGEGLLNLLRVKMPLKINSSQQSINFL